MEITPHQKIVVRLKQNNIHKAPSSVLAVGAPEPPFPLPFTPVFSTHPVLCILFLGRIHESCLVFTRREGDPIKPLIIQLFSEFLLYEVLPKH